MADQCRRPGVTSSGLGCPEWPTCVDGSIGPTQEMGMHGIIEFTNRLLTWVLCAAVGWVSIAARFQHDQRKSITRWGWAQLWIVVLNAIVGGITVWARLSPYIVAAHFIAATLLVTAATLTWDQVRNPGRSGSLGRAVHASAVPLYLAKILVVVTAILIVVGTVVTGAGPHAGDSADAQGLIGVIQSLNALPELLVCLHLLGSTLVWIGALRVLLECGRTAKDHPESGALSNHFGTSTRISQLDGATTMTGRT